MAHALRGKDFVLGNDLGEALNLDKVLESEIILKECLKDYYIPPEAKEVSALIQYSPMPGGALTANTQMMRDNNMLDKFPAVINEMREVVEKGGYGTSVTPVSQFYFQQAFNNVMMGKWKKIADGYGRMVLGYFGKTPVEPDPEIVALAAQQLKLEPTTETAIDIADRDEKKSAAWAKKQLEAEKLETTDENIFIVLACGEKGIRFLKGEMTVNVRKNSDVQAAAASTVCTPAGAPEDYTVTVNGQSYHVQVAEGKCETITPAGVAAAPQAVAASGSGALEEVKAPLPGSIFKVNVKPGDKIAEGDVVLVMEAMKMETEITAHIAGTIGAVHVTVGQAVQNGQLLLTIQG